MAAVAHRLTGEESLRYQRKEWIKCSRSPEYFIDTYCWLLDKRPNVRRWVPFKLWPYQRQSLRLRAQNRRCAILKARQIGETWLELGYDQWLLLFRSVATIVLTSIGQREARELISRLKGMYLRLPVWMRAQHHQITTERITLSTGSEAISLPSTAGDSFTATRWTADEFDLLPNQEELLESAEPTINDGGSCCLLSKVDKDRPDTPFKSIYRGASKEGSPWVSLFIPWYARPGRDQAWYEEQERLSLEAVRSLDQVHANYPATEEEALSARSVNKAIPTEWLTAASAPADPLPLPADAPPIPELRIYKRPEAGRRYAAGVDVSEGIPGGDDGDLTIVDEDTGEEVACLCGGCVLGGALLGAGGYYGVQAIGGGR